MSIQIDLSKSSDVDILFKSNDQSFVDKYANTNIDEDYINQHRMHGCDNQHLTTHNHIDTFEYSNFCVETKNSIELLQSRINRLETVECIDGEILAIYHAKVERMQDSLKIRRAEIKLLREQLELLLSRL